MNRPIIDQATRTFVNRCSELSLLTWVCMDQLLSFYASAEAMASDTFQMPSQDLTDDLQSRLELLMSAGKPVDIGEGKQAVWVWDSDGPGEGFVLLSEGAAVDLATAGTTLTWMLADLRSSDMNDHAVEDLTEQLGQCFENITLMYGIGRSMSSIEAPREMATGICQQIRATQGYRWSAVRFVSDTQDISGLSDACLISGETGCDQPQFRQASAKMLRDWGEKHEDNNLLQVDEHGLATMVGSEVIYSPIRHDGRVIGVVLAGGKTGADPEATSGDIQLLDAIAGFLGALHENAARFVEQKNMFIGSLKAVSAALDAKDRYTFGHSERVAWLGTQLARAIGLHEDEVERIRISGLVHDVGKIGVPEAVLCKTGRLTDEEFEHIKKHPRIGYNILKGIPKLADVLDGVLYHHERWDGRGYPDKLAGEAIPLYGRILAVADTFDAMSSTRSYRQAMPRDKVLQEILDCAGSQFDPQLTAPFVALDFAEYDRMVAEHQGKSDSDKPKDIAA